MNLLDLMVKVGVDDQASSRISSIGDGVKSGLGNAARVGAAAIGAAVAAAGAGAVALGKMALDSYANYEQLSGGVEKLFGDASNIVAQNAQKAYMTSGMSANQYMEQATSFSASLINSLGGDTAKAAEQADVAMRAMSDNVNVFGSNMEDVQNAFQGFAKQNYTMLDNLKLGYGGTKEEMQRLIDDANEWGAANGKASDLSIDSFSDVVTAIEQIQEKQGIAGTTAKEAATTIEGSINMTKAAWQNLLTEFGKEDGDVGARMQELVSSAKTALLGSVDEATGEVQGGIIPRVQIIFQSISESLPTMMPLITQAISEALPVVLEAITTILPAILQALVTVITTIAGQLPTIIQQLVPVLVGLAPVLLQAGIQMFLGIIQALVQSGPELINLLIDTVLDMVDMLVEYAPQMLAGALTLFFAIAQALIQRAPEILARLVGAIGQLISNVAGSVGQMLSAGAQFFGGLIQAAGQKVGEMVGAVGNLVMGGINAVGNFIGDMLNAGKDLVQGLINGIMDSIGGVADAILGGLGDAVDGAKKFLGIASPSKLFKWIGNMTMAGLVESIEDGAPEVENAMENAMRGMYDAAQGSADVDIVANATVRTTKSPWSDEMAEVMSGTAGAEMMIRFMQSFLPQCIADYTPVMSRNDFGRAVRSAL